MAQIPGARVAQTRGSRRYKAIVANLKAKRLQPCARCGQAINYELSSEHPASFVAGHIKSWEDHPELREDPANFQPEHKECGQSAGKAEANPGIGTTSEEW